MDAIPPLPVRERGFRLMPPSISPPPPFALTEQDVVRGQHNVMLQNINSLQANYHIQLKLLIEINNLLQSYKSNIESIDYKLSVVDDLVKKSDLEDLKTFITYKSEEDFESFFKQSLQGSTVTIGGIHNAKVITNSNKSILLRIPYSSDIQPSKEV